MLEFHSVPCAFASPRDQRTHRTFNDSRVCDRPACREREALLAASAVARGRKL